MPLLEERITKLLQMLRLGLNGNAIAKTLNIETSDLPIYELYIKTTIQNAISEGVNELVDIAEKTNLPVLAVAMAIPHYRIEIPDFMTYQRATPPTTYIKRHSKAQRIESIRQAITEGAKSVDEIAEKIRLNKRGVYRYARDGKIDLPKSTYKTKGYIRKNFTSHQKIEIIRQAISEGVTSLEEFCKRTHLKPNSLRDFVEQQNLELPSNLTPYKYRPNLDALIAEGATLTKISNVAKITRPAVSQYIINSGQHDGWIKKREEINQAPKLEAQQKKQFYQNLVNTLEARVSELSKKESWPIQKALQCIQSTKFTKYSQEQLVKLFERYETAKNNGDRLSVEKLGKPLGLHQTKVSRIFRIVGVEPMYWSVDRHITPREKKEAIIRAYKLDMPLTDIAYFLELPYYVVEQNMRRKFGDTGEHERFLKSFGRGQFITYAIASQIYEAQDAHFLTEDIPELIGTNRRFVDYAIEKRHELEPEIISALRIMYASENIHNPYKVKGKYVQIEPPKKTLFIYTERIRGNK